MVRWMSKSNVGKTKFSVFRISFLGNAGYNVVIGNIPYVRQWWKGNIHLPKKKMPTDDAKNHHNYLELYYGGSFLNGEIMGTLSKNTIYMNVYLIMTKYVG